MIDWTKRKTKHQVEQEELNFQTELSFNELQIRLKELKIQFMNHTFSGSQEQQSFVVAMLAKLGDNHPHDTRNVYAVDGRTRVPMTRQNLVDFMSAVDVAQEAITDA